MKKHFRITLNEGANSLCEKIAGYAARYNGGQKQWNLEALEVVAKNNILEYTGLNSGYSCTLVGNCLTIDCTSGEETINVACIEEINLFVLETENEEN